MTSPATRVLYIAHDNKGSVQILRRMVEENPNVAFSVMRTTGLYYRRSYAQSVWKLLRRSSLHFSFNRMIDLVLGRLRRDYTLAGYCRKSGIALQKTTDINSPHSIRAIQAFNPDVIAVAFTMHIVSQAVIRQARIATLGVHPSSIPEYRGLEVFFWMMANGESQGATSVFLLTPEVDIGHVIEEECWPIWSTDTVIGVYTRLTESCAKLMSRAIRRTDLADIRASAPIPDREGSYYPMPTRAAYRRFRQRGYRWR